MKRPCRGLAVAGRPALRAAAPPGLRPLGRHPACGRDGGNRPDRLPNPPRRARNRAQPRRARGCRLCAGSVPASGRRRGFAARRSPVRTDCAEIAGAYGEGPARRARGAREPRGGTQSIWSSPPIGPAWGRRLPRGRKPGSRRPPGKAPRTKESGNHPQGEVLAFCFPPPEGERIRQPSTKGARGPAARLPHFSLYARAPAVLSFPPKPR